MKAKYIFRVLFLPIMATFLLLGCLFYWVKVTYQWFKYGGEFIAYNKSHDTMLSTHIDRINELLKKEEPKCQS